MRLRRSYSTPSETRPATSRRVTLNSEPQHARSRHRERERPQVRAAVADVVHGAPDQVGHEHAGAHGGGGKHEGGDHPAAVGAQESEQAPERRHPPSYFTL